MRAIKAITTTNVERCTRPVFPRIQAIKVFALAASESGHARRIGAIGEDAALLEALVQKSLLVLEAIAYRVRTRVAAICAAAVVACAREEGGRLHMKHVGKRTILSLTTRESGLAVRIGTIRKERALMVTKAVVQFLSVVAKIAVVQALKGCEWIPIVATIVLARVEVSVWATICCLRTPRALRNLLEVVHRRSHLLRCENHHYICTLAAAHCRNQIGRKLLGHMAPRRRHRGIMITVVVVFCKRDGVDRICLFGRGAAGATVQSCASKRPKAEENKEARGR